MPISRSTGRTLRCGWATQKNSIEKLAAVHADNDGRFSKQASDDDAINPGDDAIEVY